MPAANGGETNVREGNGGHSSVAGRVGMQCPEMPRDIKATHRYAQVFMGMYGYAQGVHGSAMVVYGWIWLYLVMYI